MNKLIACALGALILFASASAEAARCKPFKENGFASPAEFADLVKVALEKDPQGSARVGQGNATVADWVTMLGVADPKADLFAPEDLVPYLRGLVEVEAPQGEVFRNAGLRPLSRGGYKPEWCEELRFKRGEKVWMNPKTNVVSLRKNCANPVQFLRKAPPPPPPPPPVPKRVVVAPPPPPPSRPPCREITFNAPAGTKIDWHVASTGGPLPPSECNAQREGALPWTAWWGECPTCTPQRSTFERVLVGLVQMPHQHRYQASFTRQTIRLHPAVENMAVSLCQEYAGGTRTCAVMVTPRDWVGKTTVDIPDAAWRTDFDCAGPR